MKKKSLLVFSFLLGLIVLLGVILRLFKLGSTPVSLYWDEVAMYVDAKTVSTTGMDMHGRPFFQALYPSYGDYKLPVYIIFASASFFLLGASELALRLPSALAGIGSIIVIAFLAKKISTSFTNESKKNLKLLNFSQLAALCSAVVMTVSPWSVLFSRTGFEGHLAQFFVLCSIAILVYGVKKPSMILLSLALGSLATYTYFSVRFVWPVVFIATWLWSNRFDIKSSYTALMSKPAFFKASSAANILAVPLLVCFGYWLSLIPMIQSPLYEASNQFRLSTSSVLNQYDYPVISNQLREMAGNTFLDRVIFHRHVLLLKELAKNYADFFDLSYLFLSGDANLRHGTSVHGLFLTPFIFFFFLGIVVLTKKSPATLALILTWWIIGILPAAVPEDTPHALRSLNALAPLVLLIGFGLADTIKQITTLNWSKLIKKTTNISLWYHYTKGVLGVLVVAISVISFIEFTVYYFTVYPKTSAFDWQDGYTQLAQHVLKNSDDVRTVWVSPFEDRFYLWLLAYGDFSAQQIQAMEKEGFKVKEIENIVFERYDWSKLESLDHKVVIIDQPDAIDKKNSGTELKPSRTTEITGSFSENIYYKVVRFEP